LKPILIDWAFLKIYSYPLLMGIAWGVGHQLFAYLCGLFKKMSTLNVDHQQKLFFGVFISSWIGAKALFLISSAQGEYALYLNSANFWLGGGFVFYGGLIFGLVFVLIYSCVLKKFSVQLLFLTLPVLCFSHAIGRVGCFLAGCCYGIISDLPWAISMHGHTRHPVQLYESFILIVIGLFLLKNIVGTTPGMGLNLRSIGAFTISYYFIAYSMVRFFLEYLRGDLVRGVNAFGFSTSQVISILIFLLAIGYRLKNNKLFKNLPACS